MTSLKSSKVLKSGSSYACLKRYVLRCDLEVERILRKSGGSSKGSRPHGGHAGRWFSKLDGRIGSEGAGRCV